jgi:hypothetical protein
MVGGPDGRNIPSYEPGLSTSLKLKLLRVRRIDVMRIIFNVHNQYGFRVLVEVVNALQALPAGSAHVKAPNSAYSTRYLRE